MVSDPHDVLLGMKARHARVVESSDPHSVEGVPMAVFEEFLDDVEALLDFALEVEAAHRVEDNYRAMDRRVSVALGTIGERDV